MENNRNVLQPKVFFAAGDLVTLKHDIDNRPSMVVQSVDKSTIKSESVVALLGVTCIWFSSDFKLQKNRFSTKDLKKIEND